MMELALLAAAAVAVCAVVMLVLAAVKAVLWLVLLPLKLLLYILLLSAALERASWWPCLPCGRPRAGNRGPGRHDSRADPAPAAAVRSLCRLAAPPIGNTLDRRRALIGRVSSAAGARLGARPGNLLRITGTGPSIGG